MKKQIYKKPPEFEIKNGILLKYNGKKENVIIPNNVVIINKRAFLDCASLASITIPDSVRAIGTSAFEGCTGLKTVYYTGTLEKWCKISFSGDSSNPCYNGANLYIQGKLLKNAVIPYGMVEIDWYMFSGCTSLQSVTIPDSVTSIGNGAFCNCINFKTVYYAGSQEEWDAVYIGSSNMHLKNANIYFNIKS